MKRLSLSFTAYVAAASVGFGAAQVRTGSVAAPAAPVEKSSDSWLGDVKFGIEAVGTYNYSVKGGFSQLLQNEPWKEGGSYGVTLGGNIFLGKFFYGTVQGVIQPVDYVQSSFVDSVSGGIGVQLPTPIGLRPYGEVRFGYNFDRGDDFSVVELGTRLDLSENLYIKGGWGYVFDENGYVLVGLGFQF